MFLIYFLFVQAFWWLRVYIASKNKRYTDKFKGTFAVIIAVLREDPRIFEKSLKSIGKYGKPAELIVSIDDYTHADNEIKRIAKKYATLVIEQPSLMGKREQYAICTERLTKEVDVIVTVDSDTIWDKTTVNILKPFNNPKVGAVSGRQTIFNADDNRIRRIAEWFEDLRFRVTLPFQSYFGQVNVIPGRTLAARADVYKKVAQIVRHETFLGRRVITSDDASVTMEVLKAGYLSVYQDDSLVSTDAPDTIKRFLKQYLRWYRGAYRRFFSRFGQIIRMHPLVLLANMEFLFATFIYAGIVLTFGFKLTYHVYDFGVVTGYPVIQSFNTSFLLLLILGYFASSYLRNLPHLLHKKSDFSFLPIFATFTFAFMALLKLTSAFGMFENGWMTRHSQKRHAEAGILATRIYGAILSLFILAVTIPLAYVVDILPTNVPFGVIVSQQGPTYYKARQVVASYQNNSPHHASIKTIESVYKKHDGNTTVALANDAAVCVLTKLSSGTANLSEPFSVFDSCHAATVQHVESIAVQRSIVKKASAPTAVVAAPFTLQATAGDSQTTLVRTLIAMNKQSATLSLPQKAFLENRLVALIGDNSLIYAGQVFQITQVQFSNLVNQSQQLTTSQLQAWAQYQV